MLSCNWVLTFFAKKKVHKTKLMKLTLDLVKILKTKPLKQNIDHGSLTCVLRQPSCL